MSTINEYENQLLIRVPDDIADKLDKCFDKEDNELIEIDSNFHKDKEGDVNFKIKFKFQDFETNGTLLDLPCIIESHKTLDKINLFKSNNISQMIYLHPNKEEDFEDIPNHKSIGVKKLERLDNGKKKVTYIARDGITPPTKCIQNRFFRKDMDIPFNNVRNIEQEMIESLRDIKTDKKKEQIDAYSNRYKNDYLNYN